MISNPARARLIKTGTYTGDGTNGRQIPVGFKCSMVIVQIVVGAQFRGVLIPSTSITDQQAAHNTDDTARHYLHATDGFVVTSLAASVDLNFNASVYYYWAIGE